MFFTEWHILSAKLISRNCTSFRCKTRWLNIIYGQTGQQDIPPTSVNWVETQTWFVHRINPPLVHVYQKNKICNVNKNNNSSSAQLDHLTCIRLSWLWNVDCISPSRKTENWCNVGILMTNAEGSSMMVLRNLHVICLHGRYWATDFSL